MGTMDSLERFKYLNSIILATVWRTEDREKELAVERPSSGYYNNQIRDEGGLQEVVKVDVRKWLNI